MEIESPDPNKPEHCTMHSTTQIQIQIQMQMQIQIQIQ